ncbi:substrate-binding domain-containing protein [Flavobacterium silvaticum]|uniref:ABC transporter substrate-binding protein n=1 Tax=Flavobacterium silvaticum TaxID=1852020 RepID=A0A972G210_9FLAO|nr:substrate-binding domain-containing protein [Flavobacterium silvaticum]NMH29016.1 ABC transporter substrate-binding protein [Flavobacterium silvaticum]
MNLQKITISGVPEHFNLPWRLCIEEGDFENTGIDAKWTDVPEGTGKLCQMLRSGETDVAVILTEGIIKDIIAGNDSKIIQVYVESPLLWGIHVAAASDFKEISDLEGKIAAISRYGSGSELMSYVNASEQNWPKESVRFEIVNTLDGAIEALSNGTSDYFMWERFMTQPIVDKGIFRRIGVCPTPWPSFVIAVRNEFLEKHPEAIEKLLSVINQKSSGFKSVSGINQTLANRYGQKIEDINQWLTLTEWSRENLSEALLNKIQNQLLTFGIMDKKGTFAQLVHS